MNNSNEEEFRKSLNDILNSKEFSFDEANWKGAEALINDKRRKKRLAFYFILSSLLIFVSGAYFYFISNVSGTKNLVTNVAQNTKVNQALKPSPSIEEKQDVKQSLNHIIKLKKETSPPAQLHKTHHTQKALTVSEKLTKTAALTSKTVSNLNNSGSPATVNSVVKNTILKTSKEESGSIQNVEKTPSKINANQTNPLVNSTTTLFSGSDTLVVKETVKELVNHTAVLKNDGINVNTNNTSFVEPTGKLPETKKSETLATPVSESENQKNSVEQSITKSGTVKLETPEAMVAKDSLQKPLEMIKPDTSITKSLASLDPCATRDKIFAELGMNYTFGWKYGNNREAAGLSPVIGLHYSNKLNKKLTASAGLRYTTLSKLQISSKTSKVTTYKLTEENDVTTITPLKVYYISLPLQLAYQLNCNNQIGVGYNLDYMVNVISNVETYHVGVSKDQKYSSSKSLGYQEGFKSFSSRLSILYRRRILKEFWFSAEFTYGLTDIKQNNFFTENKFERNTGLGISLMYNFLK